MFLGLTSPAPKNKKVWSDRLLPSTFWAAISPASTTDAVPCNVTQTKQVFTSHISENSQTVILCWRQELTWISSLKTRWLEQYLERSSNAWWFAKSSNWNQEYMWTSYHNTRLEKEKQALALSIIWFYLHQHFFSIVLFNSTHELVQKLCVFLN